MIHRILDLPGQPVRLSYVIAAVCVTLSCSDSATEPGPPRQFSEISIVSGPTLVEQGTVTQYGVQARSMSGTIVENPSLTFDVDPPSAGFFAPDARFVGYQPGTARLIATDGVTEGSFEITIESRSVPPLTLTAQGQGLRQEIFTSDLWIHGSAAYTGTWGARTVGQSFRWGNQLFTWDLSNPTQPALTDSVEVDARVVNDVKVRADGAIAVMTHEASIQDLLNGVTLLDLSDPLHPQVITRFTQSLEPGVHNAWIEGDFLYLVVDGVSEASGLRVLDISNPQQPTVVASYYAGESFLHDVHVRNGLAFLAHWDAGLIILDVGNGIAGGSPSNPAVVSGIRTSGGQTHNAWYWPDAKYVFVGEEDVQTPGIMHVVDVSDIESPVEVATYRVSGATPHNFWLDEARGVLYLAWYQNGIRALDVRGELMGELGQQGRELVGDRYAGAGGCPADLSASTCTWAPQLHNGLLYLSDLNTGIRVFQPQF